MIHQIRIPDNHDSDTTSDQNYSSDIDLELESYSSFESNLEERLRLEDFDEFRLRTLQNIRENQTETINENMANQTRSNIIDDIIRERTEDPEAYARRWERRFTENERRQLGEEFNRLMVERGRRVVNIIDRQYFNDLPHAEEVYQTGLSFNNAPPPLLRLEDWLSDSSEEQDFPDDNSVHQEDVDSEPEMIPSPQTSSQTTPIKNNNPKFPLLTDTYEPQKIENSQISP